MYDVDWTASMQQTFSFFRVDPKTWKDLKKVDTILSCELVRDSEDETLGYATFFADDIEGEFYIRIYMDVTQNKRFYHIPIGTYLVQTNITEFDGKQNKLSIDAYTPLIELKEKNPPIGFYFENGSDVLEKTEEYVRQNCRAPFLKRISLTGDTTLNDKNGFVANPDETWLAYLSAFIKNGDHSFQLTETGEIYIKKNNKVEETQPTWTYSDDEESILYPTITTNQDLYGIPNVVEILVSKPYSEGMLIRSVNNNPNSIISTVNRGREIIHRITNPNIDIYNNVEELQKFADKTLDDLSSIEYDISYTHGFCPVKIGDCVLINYRKSGLKNIKAKVKKQTIKCEPGCPVSETASYSVNLRR